MSKKALVSTIVENAGVTQKVAAAALNAVTDALKNLVNSGEKITIPGFGTFSAGTREARKCHNPKTGVVVDVPTTTNLRFKASKKLRKVSV